MGSFVFKWPHSGASEVFVTGTFDDWGKTVKLDRVGDAFEKDVTLPKSDEKIYYKFVVDGNWVTDHAAPQEADGQSNVNNVLKPEDIKPAGIEKAAISTVGAESTTAQLAGQVPLEDKAPSAGAPGAFPETPAAEPKEFSVKPIPASSGTGNPINLAPGEKVPEPTGDVNANVTTSQEDYEKAGSAALPVAAAAVASGGADDKNFSVPEKSANMIPESSLPIAAADPTVQSAGAGTTTAALAGQVPLESKKEIPAVDGAAATSDVPEVVKESIAQASGEPEAAANPEAVKEKAEVESELLKDVKPSEATGEPAPTVTAATTETAPAATTEATPAAATETAPATTSDTKESAAALETPKKREQERDVSPMTRDGPSVTTGTGSSKTEATSAAKDSNGATPESKEDKKKKRRSFFGKLKDKLK